MFLGAYVAVCAIMSAVTSGRLSPLALARRFAFTLVPIAIGYHLAHYFTFLLIQGQYIIPLASDPFGFGWNLFGTAGYRVDIAIVDARFAWITAVAAILIGHIAAVYLAHLEAMQVFDVRSAALRSQVPLTALMVVYTFVSLSILAEPLVERRTPAQPADVGAEIAVPDDAVLPEPGSGRLRAVGAGKIARQKLTYRVLGSAFHDGTRTNAADLVYSYMFGYRWGARRERQRSRSGRRRRHRRHARAPPGRAGDRDRHHLASFRVGDFEFVRELFVVEVYTSTPPVDRGAGCRRRAALEHAALASRRPDGRGGRARLGARSRRPRRSAAAWTGSISCAPKPRASDWPSWSRNSSAKPTAPIA